VSNGNWKDRLKSCFEDLALIEKRQKETLENFDQFYEFIAEPAFEVLSRELRNYKIKARYGRLRGREIRFTVNFPGSAVDNFHYELLLPRNSVELRFKLRLRGRRSSQSVLEERHMPFRENLPPAEVLKMDKETLILDIIDHYRGFNCDARTSPL
jgi:hypothetical protein